MSGHAPELPNFVQLLYLRYPDAKWAQVLHTWEDLVFSLIVGILIATLCCGSLLRGKIVPRGLQNLVELGFESFQNMILAILGPEGNRHIPFLGTLFLYILTLNWIGLIPLMKSPSTSLNVTAALALCVFVYVQYFNIKNMGFFGFLYHLAGSPKGFIGWMLAAFIIPLELLAQLARPVTLALRLFGNILGEHILLGVFALLGLGWVVFFTISINVPLQIPFVFLALLTGFMQALVFTMLSTVYILLSVKHE